MRAAYAFCLSLLTLSSCNGFFASQALSTRLGTSQLCSTRPQSTSNKQFSSIQRMLVCATAAICLDVQPTLADSSIQSAEKQIIQLFKQNTPAVVYINTFVQRLDAFSMNVMDLPAGTGSGFVWDQKGHIVTNYHVIRNAQSAKVTVTSKDGLSTKSFRAKVQGVDPDKDVAGV